MHETSVVDLFCGAGGLAFGLQAAGLRVSAGVDIDPACRYPFESNLKAPFLERDVERLSGETLDGLFGPSGLRILAGCAPCQPFSGFASTRRLPDERWKLLLSFLRLIADTKPHICTIENVSRLAKLPLWLEIVEGLQNLGYAVDWKVLDCSKYGVPQKRMRLVLLASLLGKIRLPTGFLDSGPTVRETIGHLIPVRAGWSSDSDRLHTARSLTPINLSRIKASAPGRSWRDWPDEIRTNCHKKATGRTYPSVYGRMSWSQPAPTITTQFYGFGNGRFGHPEQDRALTIREAALLQTFPDSFDFCDRETELNFKLLGRLIGNAVPPRLGEAIGLAIRSHIEEAMADQNSDSPHS